MLATVIYITDHNMTHRIGARSVDHVNNGLANILERIAMGTRPEQVETILKAHRFNGNCHVEYMFLRFGK